MGTQPRTFESNDSWYAVTRPWHQTNPVRDDVTITPDRVEAGEAPLEWVVSVTVRDRPLEAGAHVALEVPIHFRLDHGRPYPVGRGHIEHADTASPGYAAPVSVRTGEEVEVSFAISTTSRFSVVDLVLVEGVVEPGGTIDIVLGDRTGSRLRAPKFSQTFLFDCGIDADGDGTYRRIDPTPGVVVTGAVADGFRLVAPSVVAPDESFSVDWYPADRFSHNPATGYRGTVTFSTSSDVVAPPPDVTVTDEGVENADRSRSEALHGDIYRVETTSGRDDDVARITAFDRENALVGESNPVGVDFADRNVYWGDIHGQGYESIGVGTLEEYFEWGRDVEGLDFCATANHYGGRYEVSPDVWEPVVAASNRYNRPGEFATFVSYEWSAGGYGHKNVYYRGDTGNFYTAKANEPSIVRRDGEWVEVDEKYDTPEKLWDQFEEGEALVFPHHPKYAGVGRTNWDQFDNGRQRLVEIYSAWGDSEVGGDHSVRTALRRGHRVGFTGGTDTHDGQPANGPHEFNYGAGLTAVYADALTRDDVFQALYDRRTYATTGARILLDVECNGMTMGEERDATAADHESRSVSTRVVGTHDLTTIDVVRNGTVVASSEPNDRQATFQWDDDAPLDDHLISTDNPDGKAIAFYYVRVRQADRHVAWSSPIWFLSS